MESLRKEFMPTILFLVKFVAIYVLGNLAYGFFINSFDPSPDPLTRVVTNQTANLLTQIGWNTTAVENLRKPTILLICRGEGIISVFEGCNGVNVMIIFLAFVMAISPLRKAMLWFVPTGLAIIHVSNLLRIGFLFFVALYFPEKLFFMHKYLFTAFIFLVVFLLWIWWVKRITGTAREK